jgi:hypothetical protein
VGSHQLDGAFSPLEWKKAGVAEEDREREDVAQNAEL